jgi:hypothetical protein
MEMTPRRQRWASFSVRAHQNYRSLASDLLLYDRLILPYPEDEAEWHRWQVSGWDPEHLDHVYVQSGDLLVRAPWTRGMRDEHAARMSELETDAREVGYGMTARLYAQWMTSDTTELWNDVVQGLDADSAPELRPHVVAGYQSRGEAYAAHLVRQLDDDGTSQPQPGEREADLVVAIELGLLLEELSGPETAIGGADDDQAEEVFLAAVNVAHDARFRRARTALYELEDQLYVDSWGGAEIRSLVADLESGYNQAVRAHSKQTRKRRAVSILPGVLGAGLTLAKVTRQAPDIPNWMVTAPFGMLAGAFVDLSEDTDPADHPGAVFSMVRAAYRNELN